MIQPNTRSRESSLPILLGALLTLTLPSIALAHHGMDGELPKTLFQGLLSGLAHPVIGLDHLAIVLLVGAFCAVMQQGALPLASFVAATLVGCLVHVARLDLPQAERVLAVSVVLSGVVACLALRPPRVATIVLAALFGALHGYAYGESIVGAEPTPLIAYLAGFALVQLALAGAVFALVRSRNELASAGSRALVLRTLGAVCLSVGVLALL